MKKIAFIVGANALTFLGHFARFIPLKGDEKLALADWLETRYLRMTEWYSK